MGIFFYIHSMNYISKNKQKVCKIKQMLIKQQQKIDKCVKDMMYYVLVG